MNEKVYVVTSGEYSDYNIVGIFDSREKAEEYISYSVYDCNDVEEWVLNGEKPDKRKKVFAVVSTFNTIDCKVEQYTEKSIEYKDLMKFEDYGFNTRKVTFYIYTDTRERAVKIASERLRQVKAEEYFRYPLLRQRVEVTSPRLGTCSDYPYIHYRTGEIVIGKDAKLDYNSLPQDLIATTKVVTWKELEERDKKIVEQENEEEQQ